MVWNTEALDHGAGSDDLNSVGLVVRFHGVIVNVDDLKTAELERERLLREVDAERSLKTKSVLMYQPSIRPRISQINTDWKATSIPPSTIS